MGLFDSGAGNAIQGITDFVGKFFTDKTQVEKDKAALELQTLISGAQNDAAQIAVDQAEATSPDRLNHWRGFLGWVCGLGWAWHYIMLPFINYVYAVSFAAGWIPKMPMPPDVDLQPLVDLTFVMLGSHAIPHIRDAFIGVAQAKNPGSSS